jgi:hypothetical protein
MNPQSISNSGAIQARETERITFFGRIYETDGKYDFTDIEFYARTAPGKDK